MARTGRAPADLTIEELNAIAAGYGVEHLYFINRDHKVFQTNLAYDMGLVFPKELSPTSSIRCSARARP